MFLNGKQKPADLGLTKNLPELFTFAPADAITSPPPGLVLLTVG